LNVQYKKGVLELCVLSILSKRDCYGYDVSELISKKIDISESTTYPILRKLKDEGLVTTYLEEESGGPPRKYYKMTELGKQTFEEEKKEWLNFAQIIKDFLEASEKEKNKGEL